MQTTPLDRSGTTPCIEYLLPLLILNDDVKPLHAKQPTLSVVMMIYNEAARLAACLERLRFADEIVILDSGSTDTSLAICRQFGATIYAGDWPGFVAQRNQGVAAGNR